MLPSPGREHGVEQIAGDVADRNREHRRVATPPPGGTVRGRHEGSQDEVPEGPLVDEPRSAAVGETQARAQV